MTEPVPFGRFLRGLPVFRVDPPPFEVDAAPTDPSALFREWLRAAVDLGEAEAHAMTLSTVDAEGMPDARVLILKDLDEHGWWFATSAASTKGRQLVGTPAAALTFHWKALGRQVRIRGSVVADTDAANAADFRERSVAARAIALAGRESEPLASRAECERAVAAAEERLAADPGLVPPAWRRYAVVPRQVEFWQADERRQHHRLLYRRGDDRSWSRELLWP